MQGNNAICTIGVIGTPGCGKTTFCNQFDLPSISVQDLAKSIKNLLFDSKKQAMLKKNALNLSKKDASTKTARIILKYFPEHKNER